MTSPAATTAAAKVWLAGRKAPGSQAIRLTALAGTGVVLFTLVQFGCMAWLAHALLIAGEPLANQLPVILGGVLAIVLRALCQALQGRYAANASDAIRNRVRQDLVRQWHQRGPVGLAGVSAGTLTTEWLDQVDALHGYYARFLPQLTICMVGPLLILLVVASMDWLAALFLLLSAPLIPLFMALVGMGAERLNQQHMETLARLSGLFLDRVRGITTLQLFGAIGQGQRDIAAGTEAYRLINLKTLRIAFLSSAVLEFFSSVAIAVVAIYVGFGLLGYIDYGPAGELTLFTGLFILMLAPEFFQPLRQLAQHYHDRAAALGAAAELEKRLDEVAVTHTIQQAVQTSTAGSGSAIVVDNVSLQYPGATNTALEQVCLAVPPGEMIGLSGVSGSGKSTLLAALAGFISPTTGQIRVMGHPPGAMPIGWLGQQPFLKHGSWAENLQLANATVSESAMLDALRQVGLDNHVLSRRAGLQSAISEQGQGVSGGQARRLAMARLLLANYPVVLMDEPTAGLDQDTEAVIVQAIKSLKRQGCTLVIASHHPSLLATCDRVLRVQEGRVQHG
ncbi:MAG: thiol reductant ABC exporter subunit CydD [Marinobacter sp.]|nr:thiol reductant ABC exporter subunit CydD [Marinobacter sp.]